MEQQVKDKVNELLASGEIECVVAQKDVLGNVAPCIFKPNDDVSSLRLEPKYSLATIVMRLQKENPSIRLAVICRGCDERGLIELAKRNQVNLDNVKMIGIACDEKTALDCNCSTPHPNCDLVIGEKLDNLEQEDIYEEYKKMSTSEKLAFWKNQFEKCNKCYGCRNVCQMCFCKECELENELWLRKGRLPPDFPVYHLIRAFHLAGKCVGCGECENACPAGIPLMTLNRLLRDDMKDLFGYVVGADINEVNPIYTKEEY